MTTSSTTYVLGRAHAPRPPEGAHVLVLDLTAPPSDPVQEWLVDGTCALFEVVRGLLEPAVTPSAIIAVVIADPQPGTGLGPMVEAAFASTQATIHSLAMEYEGTHLSVVRAFPEQAVAVQQTVDFLASTDGGYVSAATLDLRTAA